MSSNHEPVHHPEPESYAALRTKALESLLIEKGVISTDAVDEIVRTYEQDIGPLNGARVVVARVDGPGLPALVARRRHGRDS